MSQKPIKKPMWTQDTCFHILKSIIYDSYMEFEDFSLPPSRRKLFSLRDHLRSQGALKVDTIMNALRLTVVGIQYRIALQIHIKKQYNGDLFNIVEKLYDQSQSFSFYFMLNRK